MAGLWRYPVKSLAGEPLMTATLGPEGIPGDRSVYVRGPEGVRTARRHYRLLGLRGTLDAEGRALVNGYPWDSPDALALVKAAAGDDAWLEKYEPGLFDVLPLLVATDGAIAAFGRDVRRLRPNILVGGVSGLDEVNWPGAELQINEVFVRLESLRSRCPITTVGSRDTGAGSGSAARHRPPIPRPPGARRGCGKRWIDPRGRSSAATRALPKTDHAVDWLIAEVPRTRRAEGQLHVGKADRTAAGQVDVERCR